MGELEKLLENLAVSSFEAGFAEVDEDDMKSMQNFIDLSGKARDAYNALRIWAIKKGVV